MEVRERAQTPVPVLPEARKQDPPVSQATTKPPMDMTATSPTTAPVSTASVTPPIVSAALPSQPNVTPQTSVSSVEPLPSRPAEGGGAVGGPNDVPPQGAEERKPKDPQLSKENLKAVIPVETIAKLVESSSTSSLVSSPAPALEEGIPSPPSEQEQMSQLPVTDRPPNDSAPSTSSQTGQEKDKTPVPVSLQEVGKMEEVHHPGTNGGKKKQPRTKKMRLSLIKVTQDNVVKCMLVTGNELKINFQFSSKFDETREIFKKLVVAGHLNPQEEDDFVQQAEKILRSAASKDKTKLGSVESLQETKPGKTEPQLSTEATKTSPPTTAKGNKGSPQIKPTASVDESTSRSDLAVTAIRQAKVNEVTGEVLPLIPADPTIDQMSVRVEGEKERERPEKTFVVGEVIPRPLTRDVATGMSPATNSGIVLGSQISGEEGAAKKAEPSPSLSSQTSNEVCSSKSVFIPFTQLVYQSTCMLWSVHTNVITIPLSSVVERQQYDHTGLHTCRLLLTTDHEGHITG